MRAVVVDVAREVAKVREGRKRIRLSAEAFSETAVSKPPSGTHKPSVCMFTVHDAGDSCVRVSQTDD